MEPTGHASTASSVNSRDGTCVCAHLPLWGRHLDPGVGVNSRGSVPCPVYGRAVVKARGYRYVGPAELCDQVAGDAVAVDAPASLDAWLAGRDRGELLEPFTFVVALDGTLRLAPRRSEHVALAAGREVLAAGEIAFAPTETGWRVTTVTNQSTGYCPDPDCWPAVAAALNQVGVPHPGAFTDEVIFRRCRTCGERNIVRDDDYTCALCDSALPTQWNFTVN